MSSLVHEQSKPEMDGKDGGFRILVSRYFTLIVVDFSIVINCWVPCLYNPCHRLVE